MGLSCFRRKPKGDILPFKSPTWQPKSKNGNVALLLACTLITAAMQGYDGAMMGSMNILPQYTEYFELSTVTRSLNISANYLGGALSCLCWGWVTDIYSRRFGLFWAAMITVFAAILQGAAQHIAMFCVARILIGFGTTASVISGSAYLAETLPWEQRAWGLALFDDFFYVGALAGAGVTYSAFKFESTWAWRLPTLVQGFWGLWCVSLLPWMPESPRWLVDQGRPQEALIVLAKVNSSGDTRDDIVRLQFRQICETIEYERDPMSGKEALRNRGARKRLIITATCAMFSMLTGNIFVMYNIGKMLTNAGVSNKASQLLLNVGLNASSLVVSILGSYYTDRRGTKAAALVSTAGVTIGLFIIGALTKFYGNTTYAPGIWATVAAIFFFSVSYSFGWVPILFLIPAQMLYFRIRAQGMSMFSFIVCVIGMAGNFGFPAALDAIGYWLFIANGAWNIVFFVFIFCYWVEVKGKTLEEIDAIFDGRKHTDTPNMHAVMAGTEDETWKRNLSDWMKQKVGGGEAPRAWCG
ncbi:MFS general substrate transporter [Colletotrichum zoysiae]|uniref:MFS general substrate transporter n=1 Tax=Colletotrichum zoysiae TaxID=1216348 RepID=A0AAD9HIX1_9PEZI|nr:MFS general substrate transporter [Colletotrichum zoysiae]